MKLFIGGYTKKTSKGIYQLPLQNNESLAVGKAQNIIQVSGPTYFQIDHDLVFTIDKPNDQEGGISVFKKVSQGYEKVASHLTPGSSPAYVGINRKKKQLYTANYHTGLISVFTYNDKGNLQLLASTTHQKETLGPRPEQVDGPHPHFFDETPAHNLVCCDLGNDSVSFYQVHEHELKLLARYQSEAGFGDRHLVFSKDGNYFYVAGELSSKIEVVKFDEKQFKFEKLQTISTIPSSWTSHNGAAAIRISRDGNFIYVSNRGNDSIAVFAVQKDHTLKLIQRISVYGEFPRDFNWDESQNYVVVANQNTDNATLYKRNADTGNLTILQKDIKTPEGTCVIFSK